MPDISNIQLSDGTYNIKDTIARQKLASLTQEFENMTQYTILSLTQLQERSNL